ncbi:GNAT family N-acetyltransferase [Nostocoides sp. F2B08]|uniref:GNAT family N-acetyltransferase n=1 Tax=Nostocoides sp. F2B08 TaxID=2653936 RepID=UPI00186AC4B7|nr:GNAT family N-acetyltransferase [Tetrasphaera sp. F2B08]
MTATDPSPDSATASFPDCVPVLTDGRVVLRAHADADVPRMVEQSVDPESVRWTTVPSPYTEKDALTWFEGIRAGWESTKGPFLWALTEGTDTPTYLGTIDVRPQAAGIGVIGFGLHPEARGRGLMAAALRLATRWWWDRGGVRMHWQANRGNFASWRVAHACGFTYHGVIPGHLAHRGEALESWNASVGRDDDVTRPATPWWEPVPLAGDGIRLRPWCESDVDAVEPGDSPSHFMPRGAEPTRDTFAHWLLRKREQAAFGDATHWCIVDAQTDRALGNVVLIDRGQEEGSAEAGYFLFPSARGRGVASQAMELLTAYAFRAQADGGRGLRRLTALSVGDNVASARVLERAGFTEWGREPQFCARADGTYDDARHWVRLP